MCCESERTVAIAGFRLARCSRVGDATGHVLQGWRVVTILRILFVVVVSVAAAWAGLVASSPAVAQNGYHYIVGLDPAGDNFLALRSEPSTRAGYRLARLGPQTLLAATGERAGSWLAVEVVNTRHAGMFGWVHGRYVRCCSGAAPPSPAAGYGRVAHPAGAPLNLRQGPSLNAAVIGAIPNGTELAVRECIYESEVRSWCQVSWGGRNGWVSTRYFIRY